MKLVVDNVTMSYYSGATVLRGISFTIEEDGVYVVHGGRLAGKSSLMRTIAGLERVNEGSITFDGREVRSIPMKERNLAFFVEYKPLFKHRTAYNNIAYPLKIRKVGRGERDVRVKAIAENLGIPYGTLLAPAFMLTPQEAALTQLARTLIREDASLYLLDNPLRALSGDERVAAFDKLLTFMRNRNGIYIYATDSSDEEEEINNTVWRFSEDEEERRLSELDDRGHRKKRVEKEGKK